jgi:DNA-binding NarL/FixJ family response regulator
MPDIHKMLECVRLGARAYCNSRMSTLHYQQMLQMLSTGQSWFPPQMLDETFKLAQCAVKPACETPSFNRLTAREKQVALAVADGHSNRGW